MCLDNHNLVMTMVGLNIPGIYALVNTTTQQIYIGFSNNIVTGLTRLLKDVKYSNKKLSDDIPKLEFRLLERVDSPRDLRLRYGHWVREFKSSGWTMYRELKNVTSYKVIMRPFRIDRCDGVVLAVELRSRGFKTLTVGLFNTVVEAEEFIQINYSNEFIDRIVYSSNNLTVRYLNGRT